VSGFLDELGKRLAERLIALLVLPGLLFVGSGALGWVAGGRRWALPAGWRPADALTGAGVPSSAQGGILIVLALVGLLLVSFGIGLVSQALAGGVERFGCGRWPGWLGGPSRRLTDWRLRRWTDAQNLVDDATGRQRDELVAARNRIGLQPPRRPTWVGDRLDAADARVWGQYRLDLASCWPRLWLVIPESSRQAVQAGREQFGGAMLVGAWAVLYVLLGVLWWPMVIVGIVVGVIGWRRARTSAAVLADQVEATFDVHAVELAAALGVPVRDDRLTPAEGKQITERLRKGA
jgi:hypothetical protein